MTDDRHITISDLLHGRPSEDRNVLTTLIRSGCVLAPHSHDDGRQTRKLCGQEAGIALTLLKAGRQIGLSTRGFRSLAEHCRLTKTSNEAAVRTWLSTLKFE